MNSQNIIIGFLNFRGQCSLTEARQKQAEDFLKHYNIDILHCQEIQVNDQTFSQCLYIQSNFNIITNNSLSTYGTASIVRNNFTINNVSRDNRGRVIIFDINDTTYGNVYLPPGTDGVSRSER